MSSASVPEEPTDHILETMPANLRRLINAFQIAFHNQITSKMFPVLIEKPECEVTPTLVSIDYAKLILENEQEMKEQGINLLVNPSEIPTWSRQVGALESACRAANELASQYDVGIGIAKKGMWLSFIFSKLGLSSYDVLVVRNGDDRFCCPMDELFGRMLDGKRILIFDNDAVTGITVKRIVEMIGESVTPEFVDLLLISRYSHISQELFDQVKDKLKPGQFLGKSKKGKFVLDTFLPIPSKLIRKKMALETDFKGRKGDLKRLKVRLGVRK